MRLKKRTCYLKNEKLRPEKSLLLIVTLVPGTGMFYSEQHEELTEE
jgi:hypothetical protein